METVEDMETDGNNEKNVVDALAKAKAVTKLGNCFPLWSSIVEYCRCTPGISP